MNSYSPSQITLTEQQQAIVNHNYGPALVFAVAGAGKTAALEHRIARLVQEQIFPANRILAAAYNTTAAKELKNRVQKHPGCNKVNISTLHSLALQAVRNAKLMEYLPGIIDNAFDRFQDAEDIILNETLTKARSYQVDYNRELDHLDKKDFLTWISANKGNLRYPCVDELSSVLTGTGLVKQAQAPKQNPWYLELYRLFEQVRKELGLLTFDDQLLCGWEMMINHQAIKEKMQTQYDCVLVDEFQDVNLTQSEILDMLVCSHNNYMVVGDDDQTIYEWRGAKPDFILNFKNRYTATEYIMNENFRCMLGPVMLANQVIAKNAKRRKKSLQLTRGLDGALEVNTAADPIQMGNMIAAKIQEHRKSGCQLSEIALLVRVYGQTPAIEQALIQQEIPYELAGNKPFYQRSEVQTLIKYCRLAYIERLLACQQLLTAIQRDQLISCWNSIYWQPKRYISKEQSRTILDNVMYHRTSFRQTLSKFALDNESLQKNLTELGETLAWLSLTLSPDDSSNRSAYDVLTELDNKLGYTDYLVERSSISETGVDEAETVRQFIAYARSHDNLQNFLQHIQGLEARAKSANANAQSGVLTIRSIHTAKGMEWPIVFIPSCNDSIIPHMLSSNEEEERRLLYVAITRSSQDLYIYYIDKTPISPFLSNVNYQALLSDNIKLKTMLGAPANSWTQKDIIAFARLASDLGLASYFQKWWCVQQAEQQQIAELVYGFLIVAQEADMLEWLGLTSHNTQIWKALSGQRELDLEAIALAWAPYFDSLKKPPKLNTKYIANHANKNPTKWLPGDLVTHSKYGRGRIESISPSMVTIRFDTSGRKTLPIRNLQIEERN